MSKYLWRCWCLIVKHKIDYMYSLYQDATGMETVYTKYCKRCSKEFKNER